MLSKQIKGMSISVKILIATAFFTGIVLAGCKPAPHQQATSPSIVFPYQWVGNIDKTRLKEPSGICWHSQRKTLFVVGDQGNICELTTDGVLVKQKRILHADFEGITHDPSTGLLYIAVEGDDAIIEIDPETFVILQWFSLPRTIGGNTVLKKGSQGIEAITFAPNPEHSEGGTFYVTNQSFSLTNHQDISAVLQVELPLRNKNGKPKLLGYFTPGVIDLSGLHYNRQNNHIIVISDTNNTILEYTRDYNLVHQYAFPGDNQEGITVDESGFMYIAQDSGGIIKLKPLRVE